MDKSIEANINPDEYVIKVLVGNKIHEPGREVTEEQGKNLAKQFGLPFFETSAKTNQNINEVFQYIMKDYIKAREEGKIKDFKLKSETLKEKENKNKNMCAK